MNIVHSVATEMFLSRIHNVLSGRKSLAYWFYNIAYMHIYIYFRLQNHFFLIVFFHKFLHHGIISSVLISTRIIHLFFLVRFLLDVLVCILSCLWCYLYCSSVWKMLGTLRESICGHIELNLCMIYLTHSIIPLSIVFTTFL